ncbi:unnamed protein product [Rangifer tarandus platyrhynchus]|uniref:Kazal-like domain-containing protein n=1 Tax=Rangifer tarandus platyrhynchus TaxID=3082113 RepID=A0ABN8ZA05_RANTA|nr:unnamed protein product [Rangifer tarandus platyrhynchus]CAI9688992.1 unnamed protein product [Rangifer tarandus platyrhynchus]
MAIPFGVLCSQLFFILIYLELPSGSPPWWPPHGNIKVKCPYKKVDFSWFQGTVNPCPGLYQPICGNNLLTYDNPCILCVESMKSWEKIRFLRDGQC